MKVINANAIYLDPAEMHPYQFIELAGRTCYKSENKMTESSAKKFVSNLLNAGHTAMLEHAHIILQTTREHALQFVDKLNDSYRKYINISINYRSAEAGTFISGSFRTFIQLLETVNDYQIQLVLHRHYPELFESPDMNVECDIECMLLSRDEFIDAVRDAYCYADNNNIANSIIRKHITHTIKFICDRGVSHEFVRHRPASFAQESTRYCNYSNDKFGNEITVIRPCYWADDSKQMKLWKIACDFAESKYFDLLISGATPQEARSVLPNSLKTELIITATEDEWQHIINLRYHGTTGKPHPQMYEVMEIAYPKLIYNSNSRLK